MRAYVGLGANLGDAAGTLAWAVGAIERLPGVRVRAVSRLYATAPWGVTDQPEFRNAVVAADVAAGLGVGGATGVAADVDLTPDEAAAIRFLARLKDLEREAGRRPVRRWGPRELDLDLLVFGRHRIIAARPPEARSLDADTDAAKEARPLDVPHRDAGERLFVLAPLADVAPGLVPPGWTTTVASRLREVAAAEPPDSVRSIGVWDPGRGHWS